MKLNTIKKNLTELHDKNVVILFSYSTPVAYVDSKGIIKVTSEKYSATTTRHINGWLDGRSFEIVPQSELFEVSR